MKNNPIIWIDMLKIITCGSQFISYNIIIKNSSDDWWWMMFFSAAAIRFSDSQSGHVLMLTNLLSGVRLTQWLIYVPCRIYCIEKRIDNIIECFVIWYVASNSSSIVHKLMVHKLRVWLHKMVLQQDTTTNSHTFYWVPSDNNLVIPWWFFPFCKRIQNSRNGVVVIITGIVTNSSSTKTHCWSCCVSHRRRRINGNFAFFPRRAQMRYRRWKQK